jgi:inner membrane protein
MTGPTHELIGLTAVCYFVLSRLFGVEVPVIVPALVVLASIIGAEFPDVDQPANRLSKKLGGAGFLLKLLRPFTMGHRNLTHSLLGIVLIGLLMRWVSGFIPDWIHPDLIWLAFMVAYSSHVVADWITTQGVPLFWPYQVMYGFPPDSLKRLRVNTGGFEEYLVTVPIVGFLFITFLLTNRLELLRLFGIS